MTPGWKKSAVIFSAGLLLGAALALGGRRWHRHGWDGEKRFERRLERLNSKLDLTPEQRAQVRTIFESQHQKMLALYSEVEPKFDQIRTVLRDEIRGLLRPEQQVKFDELHKEWEARWEKRRGRFSRYFHASKP